MDPLVSFCPIVVALRRLGFFQRRLDRLHRIECDMPEQVTARETGPAAERVQTFSSALKGIAADAADDP